LVRHSTAYVAGYELRLDALAQQFEMFSNLDMSDLSSLENVELPDPGTVLDTMQTPAQQPILEELQRFAAVLEGYADTVVDTVGEPLIPSLPQIEEALRRHRVDRGRAAAVVDRMLGLQVGRDHYEQGQAFCQGVVERAGLEGLDRLWASEAMVPTPNELAAPGLWLARIELV
jgi:putative hydrolase